MSEDETAANALFAMVFSTSMFAFLGARGVLTREDAIEIVEHSLLNLETNRSLAGADVPVVDRVRWMLEKVRENLPPPAEE